MQSGFENDDWLYNPNLYEHSGCVLQADGIGFEPEVFLRDTSLDAELILFHGRIGNGIFSTWFTSALIQGKSAYINFVQTEYKTA